MFFYILFFSFLIGFFLTLIIRKFAFLADIQDDPDWLLKKHNKTTPLLGGVAVFFTFVIIVSALFFGFNFFKWQSLANYKLIFGIIIGAFWLLIGGVLDDKYDLAPKHQVIWPNLAILTVITAGIGQDNLTNPLYYLGLSNDPLLHLKCYIINIFNFELVFFTDIFTFLWLFLLIYTTKFLDGLNGLVSGITVIGAGLLFFTSFLLGQPLPMILALIIGGVYLGFLPWNFKGMIFLGESGSTLAGFFLGVLAIMGPAKISITFLILGLPILDALWVIYNRFRAKKSPFLGDRRHLHFRLLARGLSEKKAVLLLWSICLVFGLLGLLLTNL